MCACILHNLLIDHVIPEEWLEEQAETEDDDEELEQHDTEWANRRDQVFYYMMEMRYVTISLKYNLIVKSLLI